jgi:hypothetical protein
MLQEKDAITFCSSLGSTLLFIESTMIHPYTCGSSAPADNANQGKFMTAALGTCTPTLTRQDIAYGWGLEILSIVGGAMNYGELMVGTTKWGSVLEYQGIACTQCSTTHCCCCPLDVLSFDLLQWVSFQ